MNRINYYSSLAIELINAIDNDNEEKAKSILFNALIDGTRLNINEKNEKGYYPLLCCCRKDNIYIATLLILYANTKYIRLNINEKNYIGGYPLLLNFEYNHGNELFQSLIDYANENYIVLDITSKDHDGDYPLLWSTIYSNVEKTKMLFDYADKNNIKLYINENDIIKLIDRIDRNFSYRLTYKNTINSIKDIDAEIIALFFTKEKENKLNIVYSENSVIKKIFVEILSLFFENELMDAIKDDDSEIAETIMNSVIERNVKFDINEKNEKGYYPLLYCSLRNNIKVAKLLVQYADKNYIKLTINEKNNDGGYPLLLNFEYNYSNEMFQLLIDYANKKNMVLDITSRDSDGDHPLLWSTIYNNVEKTKMLFDYAEKNNLKLYLNEKDIIEIIDRINSSYSYRQIYKNIINDITDIDVEIFILFFKKEIENKLYITYSENGIFKKILSKILSFLFEEEFMDSIKNGDSELAKIILNRAIDNDAKLDVNKKDEQGYYPLLYCSFKNNVEVAKLLIKYADINYITLTINERNKNGGYPLLSNFEDNYSNEMFQLLIDYANKKNIVLDITSRDNDGDHPLLWCTIYNNIEKTKMLFDYADKNNLKLYLNEKDIIEIINRINGSYSLSLIYKNIINNINDISTEIIELFYKKRNEDKLYISFNDNSVIMKRFNEFKSLYDDAEFINALQDEDNEKVKLILNNAIRNNTKLNINRKNGKGYYPLLWCYRRNNIEIAKLLIQYADKNNITLTVNERNKNGGYPLLLNFEFNYSNELFQLLIDYANKNNIVLDITSRDNDGDHPLLWCTIYNNIEKIKTLFDYANKNGLKLYINEKDIIEIIDRINNSYTNKQIYKNTINDIYDINVEIIELFNKKRNEDKLYITFKDKSELTKRINELSKKEKEILSSSSDCNYNDLAIGLYDFNGSLINELSFKKSEYLIVNNWNIKEGWASGYKRDNQKKRECFLMH